MKIHEYNEMMSYLTRPAMNIGGRIGLADGPPGYVKTKLEGVSSRDKRFGKLLTGDKKGQWFYKQADGVRKYFKTEKAMLKYKTDLQEKRIPEMIKRTKAQFLGISDAKKNLIKEKYKNVKLNFKEHKYGVSKNHPMYNKIYYIAEGRKIADIKKEKLVKKVSDYKKEESLKNLKSRVAKFSGTDLAHRLSLEQVNKLGMVYKPENYGIDPHTLNTKIIIPTEQKLKSYYKQQNQLIKEAKTFKNIPLELSKRIEALNFKITDLVESTGRRLQGIIIDEKTLKPSVYGTGKGFDFGIDPKKTMKQMNKADMDLFKINMIRSVEKESGIIKSLLNSADTETVMKIRKALKCPDLKSSGGRVGFKIGGNLLECPMAKFAEDPQGTLNRVGMAVPETKGPIMKALQKFGMGTLKWGARGLIAITPPLAVMSIKEAAEKYEEGIPGGQIAAEAAGEWLIPGVGSLYKSVAKSKMMKDIGTPQEVAAMEKLSQYERGKSLSEGAIEFGEEEAGQKMMAESQMTKEDELNLFKLMEKQESTKYWNQERLKEERRLKREAQEAVWSEPMAAAKGGRVGLKKGTPKSPGRRAFIKGIGMAAMLPFIGKYFKAGKLLTKAGAYTGPVIQKIKGMPEWLPSLVKRLWNEGEDVTKTASTMERQVVKRGTLESGDEVDLVYQIDTGDVRIDVTPKKNPKTGHGYETSSGAYNKEYGLELKKGETITEGKHAGSKTADEFGVGETEPVRTGHPEDPDWDFDGVERTVDDALSDLTELEAFAKKKTTKQIHKKKGTKPKDVNPDEGYDLDAYYDPESGTYYDK